MMTFPDASEEYGSGKFRDQIQQVLSYSPYDALGALKKCLQTTQAKLSIQFPTVYLSAGQCDTRNPITWSAKYVAQLRTVLNKMAPPAADACFSTNSVLRPLLVKAFDGNHLGDPDILLSGAEWLTAFMSSIN
jgi:hypothetical protein